jgi:two-component system LytT family sensor kinase
MTALAALAFWTVALAMAKSYMLFEQKAYPIEKLPFDASVVVVAALHCLAMRLALERVTARGFSVQILVAVVLVFAAATPFEWILSSVQSALLPPLPGRQLPPLTLRYLIPATMFWAWPFAIWAAGLLALLHDREARRRERALAQARIQAQEAQMRALRYQINPHFLHNTLNAIAALILDRENGAAEAMVIRLSKFFRLSLARDPLADVTLADEIALQRLYLGIEEVRFADHFSVEVDLPAELETALVPGLILQPLVENALKHGLRGPGAPMRLSIRARTHEGELSIEVTDDGRGPGAAVSGSGIGLANVEQRLEARFPGNGRLALPEVARGFQVRLTLPLCRA